MVVFTCNACGESLKKAQVDKHLLKCRACKVLSCIDCNKDFWGDDYKSHNKCISEDQKYGGKGFQAKVNKGDVKQQQWIQRIQQAMNQPNIEPSVWNILQKLSTHDNAPRKKAKFENWIKNCLKIYDPVLLEKVWKICSTSADSNSNQTNHETTSDLKDQSDPNEGAEMKENGEERKNKKKKRKTTDENSEQNGKNTEERELRADDYKNNKCISEDFQAKVNQGDVKQQRWIQRIQRAMENPKVEPKVRKVLQKVSAHDNAPRKKAKFENWMENCLKIYDPVLLEKVWDICSTSADSKNSRQTESAETRENKSTERKNKKKRRKTSEEQDGENTDEKQTRKKRKREEKEQNGQNADEKSSKKQKKGKQEVFDESMDAEGEEPESQESGSNSTGKFHWKGTIKAVLRDAPEDGLAVKRLRKKVLAAYYSFAGDSNFRSEEELLSLFNKKINNNPKLKILKDKVRLK